MLPIDPRAPKRKRALETRARALTPPIQPPRGFNPHTPWVGKPCRAYIAALERRLGLPATGTFTTAVLIAIGLLTQPTPAELAVDTMVAWVKDGRYVEQPAASNKVPILEAEAKRLGLSAYYQAMGWPWCCFAAMCALLAHGSKTAKTGFAGGFNVLYTVAIRDAAIAGKDGMHTIPASQCRKGTLLLFDWPGGEIVDHCELARGPVRIGLVLTVGGNVADGMRLSVRRASQVGCFVDVA